MEFILPQISLHSPVGDLTISEEDGAIVALDWGWGRDQCATPLLLHVRDRLHGYFDGKAEPFDDVRLSPSGSAYRQKVWRALRFIPQGETRTYGQIASEVGGSARSVGGANGANPIPILIPCHRVVGGTGIGGFSAAAGVATKRQLIALERRGLERQGTGLFALGRLAPSAMPS